MESNFTLILDSFSKAHLHRKEVFVKLLVFPRFQARENF